MSTLDLRVTVEITGVDEDVAETAFRSAVDLMRGINRRIDLSTYSEPHDDTRGIFGVFILREQENPDATPFTSTRKQELIKAVKSVVTGKLPSTKAVVTVKVTPEK